MLADVSDVGSSVFICFFLGDDRCGYQWQYGTFSKGERYILSRGSQTNIHYPLVLDRDYLLSSLPDRISVSQVTRVFPFCQRSTVARCCSCGYNCIGSSGLLDGRALARRKESQVDLVAEKPQRALAAAGSLCSRFWTISQRICSPGDGLCCQLGGSYSDQAVTVKTLLAKDARGMAVVHNPLISVRLEARR